MKDYAKSYLTKTKDLLDSLDIAEIEKSGDIIFEAYSNDKQIFVMGNGGSASTASHFACDLGKGTVTKNKKRFKVISLNDNVAHFSALANDLGYEHVFSEQLKNVLAQGDVVIVITASGNSPNVVNAVKFAKEAGATTIGLVGFSGGKVKESANHCIYVNNDSYAMVEDVHMMLCHLIATYFKKKLEEE